MSQKVREETYREDELRRTLEEINRDMRPNRDKSRDKRESKSRREDDRERRRDTKEDGRHSNKERGDEGRRHRREEGDERRHRDRGDDERRTRKEGDDRRQREGERRHKDGEERRHKDGERRHKDGEERRHKDGEERRHRDGEERRHKDGERRHKDGEERRHRDGEERRHKDGEERRHRDGEERRHKDGERRHKDGEERRHRDGEERRHRDGEERRHRDGEERRHRDGEERRHKDGERRHKEGDDDRRRHDKDRERGKHREKETDRDRHREKDGERHRDKERERDKGREEKKETEEERERRKKEERRQRRKEEERRKQEAEREEEERKRKLAEEAAMAAGDDEDNGYEDYEDDFEAYDDDFENESDSAPVNEKNKEMAEILRAMSAENDKLSRRHSSHRGDSASSSSVGDSGVPQTGGRAAPKSFINFVSARTRTVDAAVANRTRQRSRELLRLIHLDSTTYEMFELAEMEEYRLYMRSFGAAAANQVACQTHEDAMERESQCDPIERRTVWTQQPPEEMTAVGLQLEEDEKKRRASSVEVEAEAERVKEVAREVMGSRSLARSAQLVLRLLEEEARPHMAPSKDAAGGISNGYTELTCPAELVHLPCVFLDFAPSHSNLLLTLHSSAGGREQPDIAFVCTWNVTAPGEPQEVLESPCGALCARFSPLAHSLVFVGGVDGSLAVWDVREPAAWHPRDRHGRRRRAPTYTTAVVHAGENHKAPVIDICSLSAATAFGQSPTTFQMATLDSAGVVQLWVTTQLAQADLAGSAGDLGLRPGGRVRLSRAAKLQPTPLLSWIGGLGRKTDGDDVSACFAPSMESGAFLVGSELGVVHHVGRKGARLNPRQFAGLFLDPSAVVSLDLSPFNEPYFLAGYRDSSVRVFHCAHEDALMVFSKFGAEAGVVQVAWSRSRPAVFFALDGEGSVFVWDLLVEETKPVRRESPGKAAGKKVVRMALSNDHSATGRGQSGRPPQLGLCFDSGLEVHELGESFSVGELDETFQVANLLQSFV